MLGCPMSIQLFWHKIVFNLHPNHPKLQDVNLFTLPCHFSVQILDLSLLVIHELNRISQSTLQIPDGQTCVVSSSPLRPPLHSLPKAKVANCPTVILRTNNMSFFLPYFLSCNTLLHLLTKDWKSKREMNAFRVWWYTSTSKKFQSNYWKYIYCIFTFASLAICKNVWNL